MSGDVQPRKRKDKRKKKEGGSLGSIHDSIPASSRFHKNESEERKFFHVPDQGEKIHVQVEHGVGGNICVKIIFFCLLGLLVGAVGLIYLHSQGSTDVDLPSIEDSRFAEYFTGWLDESTDDHEHEAPENNLDDHDEHDDHDDHEDHDDGGGEEHEDDEHEEEDESPAGILDPIQKLFGIKQDEPEEEPDEDIEESYDSTKVDESEEIAVKQEDDNEEEDENEDDEDIDEEEEKDEDEDNIKYKYKYKYKYKPKFKYEENEEDEDDDKNKNIKKNLYRFKYKYKSKLKRTKEDEDNYQNKLKQKFKYKPLKKFQEEVDDKEDDDKDNSMDKEDKDEEDEKVDSEDISIDKEDEDEEDDDRDNYRNKYESKIKDEDEEDGDEDENDSEDIDDDKTGHEVDDEKDDSGVELEKDDEDDVSEGEEGNDDEEDDDEEQYDASQVDDDDEEDEISGKISKGKKTYENEENEEKDLSEIENVDNDDDDDDENENEKDLSEIEDEDEKPILDSDEKEEEDEEDDDKADDETTQDFKTKSDEDDLGYDEIDESEETLEGDGISVPQEKEKDDEKSEDEPEAETLKPDVAEEIVKPTKVKPAASEVVEENADRGEEEKEENAEKGRVAVKLGVGIALVIVAHMVLVQKWKSIGNAPTDEKGASGESIEAKFEKNEVQNLNSVIEPVISRRQTLVPENVYLNEENDEEDLEDEEEEEECDEEEYSDENEELNSQGEENVMEIIKRPSNESWKTYALPSWKIEKHKNEEEIVDEGDEEESEEISEEEDYENEEVEEEEEEDEYGEEEEEDYEEEDDEVEDERDFKWKKFQSPRIPVGIRPEEEPESLQTSPVPPPRVNKRGGQDFEDNFIDSLEEVVEFVQSNRDAEEPPPIVSEPEERKIIEDKVGNEDEWTFRQDLDFADEQFENNPKAALKAFDKVLSKNSTVLRALMGRARVLDKLAEMERSNVYLKQAINAYKTLLLEHENLLQDDTYEKLAERCIDRMKFGGALGSAIGIHKALIRKFPKTPHYRNTLAITYLILNKIPLAKSLLEETLTLWPKDGVALVHYGFILKTSDNNMEEGAKKLMAGIQTKEKGVIEGMFFFHLGDALNRLGRGKEAMEWYDLGVKEGLFMSRYQRSLYNVNRLKGQPWWTKEETTYQEFFKKLEDNWREIRKEGLNLLNSKGVNLFKQEAENLKDTGDWRQLDLFFRGRKQASCNKAPVTCSLVSSFKPAATCTRGQIKFSVMLPETHVWPHCGPTNCRLRSHLGLVVPKNTFIRVAEETRSWEEGKFIIFDDSFEHEVWHNGTGLRLVLIVDVWHPELTNHERQTLSPI